MLKDDMIPFNADNMIILQGITHMEYFAVDEGLGIQIMIDNAKQAQMDILGGGPCFANPVIMIKRVTSPANTPVFINQFYRQLGLNLGCYRFFISEVLLRLGFRKSNFFFIAEEVIVAPYQCNNQYSRNFSFKTGYLHGFTQFGGEGQLQQAFWI